MSKIHRSNNVSGGERNDGERNDGERNDGERNDIETEREEDKKLEESLDYIATYYILTMDFQNLRRLYEKSYCDELVVLTSEIINRYFSDIEISRLSDRIEEGSANEKILFLKKSDLPQIESLDPERKKGICDYIAKFYIKIAHLFSAIVMTINPEYIYVDSDGTRVSRKLFEKDKIPADAVIEKVKSNLCDSRIDALKGEVNPEEEKRSGGQGPQEPVGPPDGKKPGEIEVKPTICSVDLYSAREKPESLSDVPGIPELMELYYDANYDYETGNFKGMTEEMQTVFNADLKRFYTVFTGSTEMPSHITKFSDIKLKDYSKNRVCQEKTPSLKGNYKDKLFADYANNLKKMMAFVNGQQEKLLEVINKLFVYVKDPKDPEKEVIRINPELTDEMLQELVSETRTIIVELYIQCEIDFVEGVKLYEAIVESQILDTTQRQIATLEKKTIELHSPSSQLSSSSSPSK